MPKKLEPFFSIIIPTLNEQEALPKLLTDLRKQSFTNFEVIHIDGRSEDQTVAKAKKFAPWCRTLVVKKRNVSFQRNFGASQATGQWLIFMDADNRLSADFLTKLAGQLRKKPLADVISTLVKVGPDDKKYPLSQPAVNIINLTLLTFSKTPRPGAFGALIGIRRSLFTAQKLRFNQQNKVMEDSLLVARAKKQGYHFVLFTSPTYAYSLRRLREIGLLKTLLASAVMNLRYVFGDEEMASDYGYSMNGGSQYRQRPKNRSKTRPERS